MPPSFARMSHFVSKLFFNHKILLAFTSVATHAHSVKRSYNQAGNSETRQVFNGVLMGVCTSGTFSNIKSMTKLWM